MTSGITRVGEIELSYSVSGKGQSTVLLVMGLGGRAADWGTRFPEILARRHRVVTFDNRGTGASSKPKAHWTLDDMARDAIAVLDAVEAERAHVVGISMGGMIAQLIGLDHATRLDRLVLMSTHAGGPDVIYPSGEVASVFSTDPGTPVDVMMTRAMRLISAPGFAERSPEVIAELVRLAVLQPTPWRAFMAQLQAIIESNRSERLSKITAPTLIVHGDLDPLIPYPNGVALSKLIPKSTLVTLEGCGHLPMWEVVDELGRVVDDFLS
jgi:pimeloyl-ACP methyl ester carboxylesterase